MNLFVRATRMYWSALCAGARQIRASLFARERNLDGPLDEFVMKPGYFWQWLGYHKQILLHLLILPLLLLQLLFGYVGLLAILVALLLLPVVALIIYPIFAYRAMRRLKKLSEQL